MAFTKSPEMSTYQTTRVSLTREINARDGGQAGKDEDFVNMFIEPVRARNAQDNRQFIVKRAGTEVKVPTVGPTEVRGVYFWKDQNKLLYAVGQNIYIYDVNAGTTVTLTTAFTTSTGEVGFCSYLYEDNTVVVMATDGTTLNRITTAGAVTACTDPDMPTPHLPYPVFIDGYLFLVKTGTADVYNSDLNDPMAWTAGDLISAEMEGDLVIRIAKLNNYLIVFGTETVEYFWDAGNATGSPLQRNDTPVKMNTYLGGFAQYENAVYFMGAGAGGQPDVYMLKDFKIDNLGSPTVSRYLSYVTEDSASWHGAIVSCSGHSFYLINAGATQTWAYDLETKLWARWKYKQTDTFQIKHSALVKQTNGIRTYFTMEGSSSEINAFSESLYQDAGTNFTCQLVTESNDFGTMNRKMMARWSYIGDRPNNTSYAYLSWSDDDYQSYNTPQAVNLDQDLCSIYRLGWFRQRNFKLTYTDNYPMRVQEFEVDINKGSS